MIHIRTTKNQTIRNFYTLNVLVSFRTNADYKKRLPNLKFHLTQFNVRFLHFISVDGSKYKKKYQLEKSYFDNLLLKNFEIEQIRKRLSETR